MNKIILLSVCAVLAACGGANNAAPATSVGVGASTNIAPNTSVGVGTSSCVANCAGAGPSSISNPRMRPTTSVSVGMAVRR